FFYARKRYGADAVSFLVQFERRASGCLAATRFAFVPAESVAGRILRDAQQLLFLAPVEGSAFDLGLVAALVELLIQADFLVRHVVQAVTAEEPEQVARHQMGH